jgi:hypothetical protein
MEAGGREPVRRSVWVLMLAVEEIPTDDRTESAIKQELTAQPVDKGREP